MQAYIVFDILTNLPFIVHGHCGDYYPMWDNPISALSYIDMLDIRIKARCEVRSVIFVISGYSIKENGDIKEDDKNETKTEGV